jgi:hypothetical protein
MIDDVIDEERATTVRALAVFAAHALHRSMLKSRASCRVMAAHDAHAASDCIHQTL